MRQMIRLLCTPYLGNMEYCEALLYRLDSGERAIFQVYPFMDKDRVCRIVKIDMHDTQIKVQNRGDWIRLEEGYKENGKGFIIPASDKEGNSIYSH